MQYGQQAAPRYQYPLSDMQGLDSLEFRHAPYIIHAAVLLNIAVGKCENVDGEGRRRGKGRGGRGEVGGERWEGRGGRATK